MVKTCIHGIVLVLLNNTRIRGLSVARMQDLLVEMIFTDEFSILRRETILNFACAGYLQMKTNFENKFYY